MPPIAATVVYLALIAALFWLDRDRKARTSFALWIPWLWIALACSRSVAQWLEMPALDTPDQVLEGNPVDRMVYVGFLAVGLIIVGLRWKRLERLLQLNWPFLLFFFFCLVSLFWSEFPDVAFKRWTKGVGDIIMILIVLSERQPSVAFQRLLSRLAYVLIPMSVLFIKYYPDLGKGYGLWEGEAYYVGVTTNKNTLGAICLGLGLATLWRLISAVRDPELVGRKGKIAAQVLVLVMVAWLFKMAQSMTALSCFMMGCVLLVAANLRMVHRRPVLIHLLVAAMLVASVSVLFLGASPETLKTMGKNSTLTDRTDVWATLLTLVRHPLTGTGYESFWLGSRLDAMWSKYWWHPNEAHNGYLEVYLNVGWLGIGLLAIVLFTSYRATFRAWRSNIPAGSLCLTYCFVGMAYNFTEAAFFKMLAPMWLFFLLGVISVSAFSYQKSRLAARKTVQQPVPANWQPEGHALHRGTV